MSLSFIECRLCLGRYRSHSVGYVLAVICRLCFGSSQLSLKGWVFGQSVRNGVIVSRIAAANWLRENIYSRDYSYKGE